jgi:bifunctional non-homologous end joining protein LigD
MFAHACKVGLEGVVSKVCDSRYVSGRGNDWVKKTCAQRETLPIAGFALDGDDWDGIYVGRYDGDELVYAGKVDHGFDRGSAEDLRRRLTPLIRETLPYARRIAHRGIWVEPKLLAEIEYRTKSAEGKVRHRSSRGSARICDEVLSALQRIALKVCEAHPDRPWSGTGARRCGAGAVRVRLIGTNRQRGTPNRHEDLSALPKRPLGLRGAS